MPPDIHHLNGGGHAGQKRRGDEFTIPLCKWHHVGEPGIWKRDWMLHHLGPSLKQSKAFRQEFGSDDVLLRLVNIRIRAADTASGLVKS